MTKSYSSLKITMLSNLLFALGVAIALFLLSNVIFDTCINNRYLAEEKAQKRIVEVKDDLQAYVTENNLSSGDIDKMSEWAKDKKYLYVLIYKDDELLFETGGHGEGSGESKENANGGTGNPATDGNTDASGNESEKQDNNYYSTGITVKTPAREELIASAVEGGSHKIVTSDGTLIVCMADYTEYLYYDIFNIVSFILGFGGFFVVMWLYFFEITKKITRLGREVTAVADGEVTRQITADGEDEITRLCADVEYMRISMLENIEKEHAALESNKELITAMSHDIRTPLTVLLGYLDIMKSNSPDPDMMQYIDASERTALRLKKMSDDMFGYFLVYGGGIEVAVEECEARVLVDQMLSGHVFLLREQGYDIEFNFESEANDFLEDVTVVTDPPQLMRIVENLFSNIMKYADREKPVTIGLSVQTDEMTIKIVNFVTPNPDPAQKNGIGLRSCKKLAKAMDVTFTSEEVDGVFTTVLSIPIIPDIEEVELENNDESEGIPQWLRSALEKCKSFFVKVWQKMKSFSVKTARKIKSLVKKEK